LHFAGTVRVFACWPVRNKSSCPVLLTRDLSAFMP
jgi:hypothetical protein